MADLGSDTEYFLHRTGLALDREEMLNQTEDPDGKARFVCSSKLELAAAAAAATGTTTNSVKPR